MKTEKLNQVLHPSQIRFKFYLKDANSAGISSIVCVCSYGYKDAKGVYKQLKYTTGISVNVKHWNSEEQKVNQWYMVSKGKGIEEPSYKDKNNRLTLVEFYIRQSIEELYNKIDSIPSPETLKPLVDSKIVWKNRKYEAVLSIDKKDEESVSKVLFNEFVSERIDYIKSQVKQQGNNTRKGIGQYTLFLNKFKDFERTVGKTYSSDEMNEEVIEKFNSYILKVYPSIATRTFMNYKKNFKKFLFEANRRKLSDFNPSSCPALKKSEPAKQNNVYLTFEEIEHLYKTDVSLLPPSYEHTKDLFVVMSYIGARVSDWKNVEFKKDSSNGEYYTEYLSTKTGSYVKIPCFPIVVEIFKKYKGKLPVQAEAVFNRQIKEIISLPFNKKINVPVMIQRYTAGNVTGKDKIKIMKVEKISSHTCRRNFCSNLYMQGFDAMLISKFSGHNSIKELMKYICVSDDEVFDKFASKMKEVKL